MQFELRGSALDQLVVVRNGNELVFNVFALQKTHLTHNDSFTRDINALFAYLPEETQTELFMLYTNLHNLLSPIKQTTPHTLNELRDSVADQIAEVYKRLPYQKVEYWVRMHSQIVLPSNLEESVPVDGNRDKTFTLDDYRHLVVLTVLLRAVVPVWGEYLRILEKLTTKQYKEMVCLKLLIKSYIMDTPVVAKLCRYLEVSIGNDADTNAAVIDRLSTEELPEWLMGLVLVRRLSVAVIDAAPNRGHLISNIYGYLQSNALRDLNNRFGGIREKTPQNDQQEETSALENHKLKQHRPASDRCLVNIFVEDPYRVAFKLDPTIPKHLVLACAQAFNVYSFEVEDHHPILCKLVLQKVISPHAVGSLTLVNLINALIACMAVLWYWGYHETALLCNAQKAMVEQTIREEDGKLRFPADVMEKLNALFPYDFSNLKVKGGVKYSNIAAENSRVIAEMVKSNFWQVQPPEGCVIPEHVAIRGGNVLEVSSSIAVELANVVIKVVENGATL